MPVRECPSCALEFEYEAEHPPDACPYCGYEFPDKKSSTKIFALLFVLLMLVWMFYELIVWLG